MFEEAGVEGHIERNFTPDDFIGVVKQIAKEREEARELKEELRSALNTEMLRRFLPETYIENLYARFSTYPHLKDIVKHAKFEDERVQEARKERLQNRN